MDTKSYQGVTRADVDKIRREIGNFGIAIPEGDDVEVKGPLGVKMRFVFDEPNEILNLTITAKPGYVSDNQIWKVIEMSAGKIGRG